MRKIKIIMDGKEVTAELIDRNPKTAGAVWNALPLQGSSLSVLKNVVPGSVVRVEKLC